MLRICILISNYLIVRNVPYTNVLTFNFINITLIHYRFKQVKTKKVIQERSRKIFKTVVKLKKRLFRDFSLIFFFFSIRGCSFVVEFTSLWTRSSQHFVYQSLGGSVLIPLIPPPVSQLWSRAAHESSHKIILTKEQHLLHRRQHAPLHNSHTQVHLQKPAVRLSNVPTASLPLTSLSNTWQIKTMKTRQKIDWNESDIKC